MEADEERWYSRRELFRLALASPLALGAISTALFAPEPAEAKKPRKYSISYRLDFGFLPKSAPRSFTKRTQTFSLPTPAAHGLIFQGWYKDKACTKHIKSVKKGSSGNLVLYPKWKAQPYWKHHLDSVIPQVKKLDQVIKQHGGDSFVFITDVHVTATQKKEKLSSALVSPFLVNQVLRRTSIKRTFFGGDILTFRNDPKNAKADLAWWKRAMSKNNVYGVLGNHDTNTQSGSNKKPKSHLKRSYVKKLLFDPKVKVVSSDSLCYVLDNRQAKIRYVFLDSGDHNSKVMPDSQVAWMQRRLCELKPGWSVVVLMHQLFNPCYVKDGRQETTFDPNGKKVMKGIDEVFDSLDATVIGVLGGHCHRDECLRSKKGYPLISTTADAFSRAIRFDFNYPKAKLGTINEHAFDCVHIDTQERRITMTRIGRGARSRCFEY